MTRLLLLRIPEGLLTQEVDPLLCPKCGVEMKVVSVITDSNVVDQILRHVEERGDHDPFESRPPPDSPTAAPPPPGQEEPGDLDALQQHGETVL